MNIQNELSKLASEYYSSIPPGNNVLLTDLYLRMVKIRNSLAVEKGFNNYFDLQSSFQGVNENEWQHYIETRNVVAKKYSSNLDSQSEYPHFLSKIKELNMSFPKDVYRLFDEIAEMKDIEEKIDLMIEGKTSKFKFNSVTGRYLVTIADTNHNQKIAMLIHELSHVADQEKSSHKITSIFESELGAHKMEFKIAKNISEEFFVADVREYLHCFVRSDFESSIYTNPNQSAPELFSSIFNKYFGRSTGNNNYLFLRDDKIIQKPLSDLSVAVAITSISNR